MKSVVIEGKKKQGLSLLFKSVYATMNLADSQDTAEGIQKKKNK